MKRKAMGLAAGIVLMFALSAPHANADAVGVAYTVTGSANNWTLDFTVTNNIPAAADEKIYFFGVDISPTDVTGIPAGWGQYGSTWNTSTGGEGIGDNITFPDAWITGSTGVASGASLSGFEVLDTAAMAPTDVAWFAYGIGGDYTGDWNYFGNLRNPGFQGDSSISSTPTIPEPSTNVLMLTGLGLLGLMRKRIVSVFGVFCLTPRKGAFQVQAAKATS